MHKVFIAGAGTIGTLIATLLSHTDDYDVYLVDKDVAHIKLPAHSNLHLFQLDVSNQAEVENFLKEHQIEVTISSLPYFHNLFIAKAASKLDLYYFDLTEDITVTAQVRELASGKKTAFVPQCGVAPGFINIVANHLMYQFDKIRATYLRAGCLPKSTHNALQYAITWSLDGLINEYGNTGYALVDGKKTVVQPLVDLEMVELDGTLYEAFNTSGGVGSLVETYENKVETLNYKTLRYPGHCEKMRFLMDDLHLNEDRATLKTILQNSLPRTDQDVMLIYVAVTGEKAGSYFEQSYVKKVEPSMIYNQKWSAIQISTASALCAVVDMVLDKPNQYQGFVLQEQFPFDTFLANRFGKIYNA